MRIGIRARVPAYLLLSALIALAACGKKVDMAESDNPDEVTPPATAGTADSLIGTSWRFDGLDMIVTFNGLVGPGGALQSGAANGEGTQMALVIQNPNNPQQTAPGFWLLRPNGVISVTSFGTTRAGTWDGERLILAEEEGERASGE